MKNLKEIYDVTLEDCLNIYEKLEFKAQVINEKNIDCILLSDIDNTPLQLVHMSNSLSALNYDDVKDILIDLELEFKDYNCNNYILISKFGYSNTSSFIKGKKVNVYDIQNLNIKLEDASYLEKIIKASKSDKKYFELNAHNKIAYDNIKNEFNKGNNRIYIKHATGTGKSIVVSKYINDEVTGNTLLLSSSNSIINQFSEHLSSFDSNKLKMFTYNKLSQININELNALKEFNPELIILDEFHRCGAKVWGYAVNELLNSHPNSNILGTSATPTRYLDNTRDMGEELFKGNIVSNIDLCEAIVRGILPMPTYVITMYDFYNEIDKVKEKLSKSKCSEIEKAETLKKIEVLNSINETSELVRSTFNKHLGNKRNFVIFCKDFEHMKSCRENVSSWFNSYIEDNNLNCNINSYELYSAYSDNKDIIKAYKNYISNNINNDFNLLFSIDMANEGIHSKYIDGVILLRPTKSPILYYQQIGRALHVNPINNPIIFDFVNNSEYIQAQNFISGISNAYNKINNITSSTLSSIKNVNVFLNNIYDETKDIIDMLNNLEDSIKVGWEEMLIELIKFKNRRGTTIVRHTDDKKLYRWVLKNRYQYLNNQLPQWKKDKLDSIGFVVDAQDAVWFEHYEDLKEHKKLYGHINVSSEYNLKLSRFVKSQRRLYEQGTLPKDRLALLDKLGMIWNINVHKWESKFLELVEIHKQLGTLYPIENNHLVTHNGATVLINEDLMHWIKCQRKYYTNGELSSERIEKLESLGLALNLATKSFNDNMNALRNYVRIHGHANVQPQDGDKLYNWIRTLRRDKLKGRMDENLFLELEKLGFTWSRRDEMWEDNFSNYISYITKYGTPLVEKSLEGYDDKLARWVAKQRREYTRGELSSVRVKRLNSIGFIWDAFEYKWMLVYNELKEFIYSLGETKYTSRLIKHYKGDIPLVDWMSTQKKAFKSNQLSENRYNLLLELGIDFN